MTDKRYNKTIRACSVGYIVQAINNVYPTLLYLMFQTEYGISLSKITALIGINFGVQFIMDALVAKLVDKIGYRASSIIAHSLSAAGFVLMALLPDMLSDAFVGLLIGTIICALGGGFIEVIISPMVEACPTENKEKTMALLHSFYHWGFVIVVGLSTLFFSFIGLKNWKILTLIWAAVPVINALVFLKVPIAKLLPGDEKGYTFKEISKQKVFWIFILMMLCAGACEISISSWVSTFAEKGLGVSKTVGDIAGPLLFALTTAIVRTIYGKFGNVKLEKFMFASSVLCVAAYLLIALSPIPVLSLVGCGICGVAIAIMWPGTYSLASKALRRGGTMMFALLALAGDLGNTIGPTLIGQVAVASGDNLNYGILAATVFPVLLVIVLIFSRKTLKRAEQNPSNILQMETVPNVRIGNEQNIVEEDQNVLDGKQND